MKLIFYLRRGEIFAKIATLIHKYKGKKGKTKRKWDIFFIFLVFLYKNIAYYFFFH